MTAFFVYPRPLHIINRKNARNHLGSVGLYLIPLAFLGIHDAVPVAMGMESLWIALDFKNDD